MGEEEEELKGEMKWSKNILRLSFRRKKFNKKVNDFKS